MVGAIIRHGPHHAAHASTSTGLSPAPLSTSPSVASVTSTGFPSVAAIGTTNSVLHRPHSGCVAWAFVSSTRFFAPQFRQVMIVIWFSRPAFSIRNAKSEIQNLPLTPVRKYKPAQEHLRRPVRAALARPHQPLPIR